MQEWEKGHASYLRENSLIRLIASLVCISLIAASGVLFVESNSQLSPLFQVPGILITLGLGILALYASSLAVTGRRSAALASWATCIICIILLPFLQFLPINYQDTPALLDIKALAPPLWPYAIAIPLLLFLLLDTSIPSPEHTTTSNLFLCLGLLSSVMFLFFTTVLVGSVVNISELMLIPHRLFLSMLTPVGISSLIVLATVLTKKGLVIPGISVLVSTGLGIEFMSTWSYDGPHFIDSAQIPYPRFPMLPVLAGTIPGILSVLAGILAAWEVYIKRAWENEIAPIADDIS